MSANAAATRVTPRQCDRRVDQGRDVIRFQRSARVSAHHSRHHSQHHGANGAGCKSMDRGWLRYRGGQQASAQQPRADRRPGISYMQNRQQRFV